MGEEIDFPGWENTDPCEHIQKLKEFLKENEVEITTEFSEDPYGWVNIRCNKCNRGFQACLRPANEYERGD
jgi:hypothetical protein